MEIYKDIDMINKSNIKNDENGIENKVEVTVNYGDNKKIFYAEKKSNLFEVLREENLSPGGTCSGKGICGKCKVLFINGAKSPSEIEIKHLSEQELKDGMRLACLFFLDSPVEIQLPAVQDTMNVLTGGSNIDVNIEPCVKKKYVKLDKPSLKDQRSDYRRLADGMNVKEFVVNNSLLAKMPTVFRDNEFMVTTASYKNILINLEGGDTSNSCYGAALDIGTTTVACYLVDLSSGVTIDVESAVNKQRAYGADVISRINYTMENKDGSRILKDSIILQVNGMLKNLCIRNKININDIYNMTVAGNTTMTQMFLGLPCQNIALSPYIPVVTEEIDVRSSEIGIDINGYISVLPGIASYVGSDITAGILACGMYKSKGYSLLLDLGTNGEIALGNRDGIIACSTAAGPAFEGANIKCGIGGIRGAISKIDLSSEKLYETIGGINPCGICGSGVLDMTCQLLKYNLIDETGRIPDIEELSCTKNLRDRMIIDNGMKEFVIDKDIVFTQKDVREVQLASAAVSAGIKILLKEKAISAEDVENIFVAGGFGNFMNIDSAVGIGLLPKGFSGRIKSIGNSAGTGAKICLISSTSRDIIKDISHNAEYIELSGRQDFQDYFVDSMMFGG